MLSRPLKAFVSDTSGAAAIEFAITLVPLTLLLLGAITYGGVIASKLALEHAASEGARAGISGLTLCERREQAANVAQEALVFGQIATTAEVDVTATDNEIRVAISFDYQANPLTPVLYPVPEQLIASAVAHTDGPEFPAQPC
jgi:Flp pilus assembly protein TadG